MAPAWGSYNRQSSFANVVFPAPFCPTTAREVPAGITRLNPSSTHASVLGYENLRSLKQISRAGMPTAGSFRSGKAPAVSIGFFNRATAPTGADALSSAQDKPPKPIMLVAAAALANVTS